MDIEMTTATATASGTKAQNKVVRIALIGESLEKPDANVFLTQQINAIKYRDAFLLKDDCSEIWLFDYGVLVAWDCSLEQMQACYNKVNTLLTQAYEFRQLEQYYYQLNSDAKLGINNDVLLLPDDAEMTRLALSHAFAQSAKLDFFESKAKRVIQDNAFITKTLAEKGKIPLTRKEVAKLNGVLFDTTSDITLHFNLLDTPEFFWENPALEGLYLSLARYLDLQPRLTILDKRLATIHHLAEMLSAEQNHKHSAFLEWVIIVLIAVDILIYFI